MKTIERLEELLDRIQDEPLSPISSANERELFEKLRDLEKHDPQTSHYYRELYNWIYMEKYDSDN